MNAFHSVTYEFRVEGHLSLRYSAWFDLSFELCFEHEKPITVLTGPLPDQAALHGVLNKIQSLGLNLLELKQIHEPYAESFTRA